jgi:protein ImuB
VLFLVRAALDRLVGELIAEGRAAAAVAITLTLDDRRGVLPDAPPHTITRELRPARPIARVAPLFEQCHALLDTWRLDAPVCGVAVSIPATAPLSGDQGDLLAIGWRDPAAAQAAFTRLRAELGPEAIVRPVTRDEHRPERAGAWEDAAGDIRASGRGSGRRDAAPGDGMTARTHDVARPGATRLIETPEVIDVECANGAPRLIRWRGRSLRIAHARGPERLSGDWWKDRYARDYWRCQPVEESRELLLYRERRAWFVQGWYD